MKNILEFLETDVKRFESKKAFIDENSSLTYGELCSAARSIGTYLAKENIGKKPVAIYLDKSVKTVASMLGIVYAGCFYAVVDSEMPIERISKIFSSLNPSAVITDSKYLDSAKQLGIPDVFLYDEAVECEADDEILCAVRDEQIDTDPLYALYTSGSTGMPKGALLSHRNVIAYSEWAVKTFNINEDTVFGNQTPFYFSMSVTDVYSTLRAGATLVIIPKPFFTFPIKLIGFLNEYKVNTIYWVPSAMAIVSSFKLFEIAKPEYLKTVLFAGEVMPVKHLNYWRDNLGEDILFANLYGPTETTDICTYYIVDRRFTDGESLPIGRHCDNCNVFIVNEKGEEAAVGEEGELYARGSFLAFGYYNNPEKTAEAFVQNPLNTAYPERVYKTGDLVRLEENGEISYICRKDYQIKHMGYRIELGEIEAAVSSVEGVNECACVFDDENDKIVLFYTANRCKEDKLMAALATKLTSYLMPNKVFKLSVMPHNQNGKIDRKLLKDKSKE